MPKTDRYRLTPQDCNLIALASSMHDIGKIAIDAKILNKPGKLTPEEFEQMKQHTILARRCSTTFGGAPITRKLVRTACDICRWHHERDGHGYPDGLVGDETRFRRRSPRWRMCTMHFISERVYNPRTATNRRWLSDPPENGACLIRC